MIKNINIGIDLGSRTAKIVVLNSNEIIHSNVMDTGVNPKVTSEKIFEQALKDSSLKKTDIGKIYSTGYGRNIVPFADKVISEISCHARGVNFLFPDARTIIDIGGQDSKVILIGNNGKVSDFAMNDKCAAGTGKFLEVVATTLETTVDELGELSARSKEEFDINSTCVVFAESEIIGMIAQGKTPEDITRAVHHSIARRTKNLVSQLHWQKPVVFTGGVALNSGMQTALADILKTDMIIPENSFITGALGAALFALEGL
ncbi:MAG: 2-hydroxyglutaryl-CoA dehydratase [Candidatus Cloacimonetes bacterium]|nr:2-hydroxyglutaryl-CoA dehydratase [Candidatus Cloacimonadota bacterium]